VQERNVRRALEAAKRAAGLAETDGRLSMHTLRHAYCSALATAGPRIVRLGLAGSTQNLLAETPEIADVLERAATAGLGG